METVQTSIQKILKIEFAPNHLEVINESHLHEGHEHMGPETHFRIRMVSNLFDSKKSIERHRMVHGALNQLLKEKIHAIVLDLYTPFEWSSKSLK